MVKKVNRVALVGTGFVGSSYAFALLNQGITEELVLIDVNEDKAKGEELDLNDAVNTAPSPTKIWQGNYSDCKDADIVCITAGIARQSETETRLEALARNTKIFHSIIDPVMASGFDGIFLIASNPVDIMTYVTWKLSGLPKERVIGTGTLLDTARYRFKVGEYFNVDTRNVDGYIIGEHGDSSVAAWNTTTIGGRRVEDIINSDSKYDINDLQKIYENVRDAATYIIDGKGSTYYGIGMALAKLTKAVLRDENTILPVSAYLVGQYGAHDVYAGVPAIINRQGVREIIELDLTDDEKEKFAASIEILKSTFEPLAL